MSTGVKSGNTCRVIEPRGTCLRHENCTGSAKEQEGAQGEMNACQD
jgi:hypothetical protein